MSFAEELLREGELKDEKKGKIEGRLETIAEMLKVGVAWETIERATGIDPRRFAEMKQELERMAAADSGGSLQPATVNL